ncbi:MAG: alpha/beta hydrolase [Comamonadaceae bacterium]|nr:MAG: alpha/beta hydrolase [Comamonadaceae bacterium]
MTPPLLDFVECPDAAGRHRMAFWQWGDAAAPHVVLCVHGLTRQGRDFDVLAQHLIDASPQPLRVVCPDVLGRGRSDWLADPMGYQVPQYAGDMVALLHALHAQAPISRLDYVGTSMGGLIGMVLAGHHELPLPTPVHRLVLNDVGPVIQPSAIARITRYVGQGAVYDNLASAAAAMWAISTGFGPHTEAQWLALSAPMVVPVSQRSDDGRERRASATDEGGPVRLHYDPAIAQPLLAITPEMITQAEQTMWALYDAITAPTLLIRGADSDLLSPATAAAMTQRGPRARLTEFSGVGHAPTFVAPEQSAAVAGFLLD